MVILRNSFDKIAHNFYSLDYYQYQRLIKNIFNFCNFILDYIFHCLDINWDTISDSCKNIMNRLLYLNTEFLLVTMFDLALRSKQAYFNVYWSCISSTFESRARPTLVNCSPPYDDQLLRQLFTNSRRVCLAALPCESLLLLRIHINAAHLLNSVRKI